MDNELKHKAMLEIMKSCDVIVASNKKGIAEKVGKELGGKLYRMGVKAVEAEVLLEIVRSRIFDLPDETDLFFISLSEQPEDED